MLLRGDMPKGARENFPKFATRLYETEDDVREQLAAAGFLAVDVAVKPDAPGRNGLLVLARACPTAGTRAPTGGHICRASLCGRWFGDHILRKPARG